MNATKWQACNFIRKENGNNFLYFLLSCFATIVEISHVYEKLIYKLIVVKVI